MALGPLIWCTLFRPHKVSVFVNTTRTERNLPQYRKCFFFLFVSQFASEGEVDEGEEFLIAEETIKVCS